MAVARQQQRGECSQAGRDGATPAWRRMVSSEHVPVRRDGHQVIHMSTTRRWCHCGAGG
jgi:hypothetical protein